MPKLSGGRQTDPCSECLQTSAALLPGHALPAVCFLHSVFPPEGRYRHLKSLVFSVFKVVIFFKNPNLKIFKSKT